MSTKNPLSNQKRMNSPDPARSSKTKTKEKETEKLKTESKTSPKKGKTADEKRKKQMHRLISIATKSLEDLSMDRVSIQKQQKCPLNYCDQPVSHFGAAYSSE